MQKRVVLGFVLVAVLIAGLVRLDSGYSAVSVLSFGATADATIDAASPSRNYGSALNLVADASPVRSLLVKFDVQTAGCAPITKVTLNLSVGSGASDGSLSGGQVSVVGTAWAENTVNWTTAPGAGLKVATFPRVLLNTTYSVDVTSAVVADGSIAFRVDSTNTDGVYYLSKEGAPTKAAQLVVTCGVAPPTTTAATTTTVPGPAACVGAAPPAKYDHVVVIMEENRRWADVGAGFSTMPYLRSLAASCAYYPDWSDANGGQSSLSQYIALTSGIDNPATANDCIPSATCRSTDDNIFRQVRAAGGTARSYVEGATAPCSATGNVARHVPALYYYGANDDAFCAEEVRPFSEFDPNNLPTFAFVTPNLCNDGHDCTNDVVDAWLQGVVPPILATPGYQAGTTAVLVLYDEDRPVPNLLVSRSARPGPIAGAASHALALQTIESMLGLPKLGDLRTSSGL